MLKVRLAVESDLDGIMEVEQETFGELSEEAMASPEVMTKRIAICNNDSELGWFWVAEYEGHIVGDAILQPTNLTPQDCTSWIAATDNGTLINTFHPDGKNIFAVSMAITQSAPSITSDVLVLPTIIRWLETGKQYFMFCSRISGFNKANEKTGISIDDYWQLKDDEGKPHDGILRFLCQCVTARPFHLQRNGFPPDKASGGHSVLCAGDNPIRALNDIIARIYHTAAKEKQNIKDINIDEGER